MNAALPPFHEQIVQRNAKPNTEARADGAYAPGPGHYEIGVGFEKIGASMKQIKELQAHGLDVPLT